MSVELGRAANSSILTPVAASAPPDVLTCSKWLRRAFFCFASASMLFPATLTIAALDGAMLKSSSDATDVASAFAYIPLKALQYMTRDDTMPFERAATRTSVVCSSPFTSVIFVPFAHVYEFCEDAVIELPDCRDCG